MLLYSVAIFFSTISSICYGFHLQSNLDGELTVNRDNTLDNVNSINVQPVLILAKPETKSLHDDMIITINGVDFGVEDEHFKKTNDYNVQKETPEDVQFKSIKSRDNKDINYRPIIGILAQELSHSLEPWYGDNYTSYIGAAYVKWVEQAGARVVPVLINQDEDYYETIFSSTNGLVIPGGAVSLDDSGYAEAGKILFNKAINSGTYWPIWGSCLGFELLAYLSNEEQRNLLECSSQEQPLALNLTEDYYISHFAKQTSDDVTDILSTQNVTVNFHSWCLTPEKFEKFEALRNFWYVLSTNKDWDGLEFISLMEARNYPMWGAQYHPEKNAYEWTPKYPNIPHFKDAIHASAHQAEFFVEETRKNSNSFNSREEEEKHLIYSYQPEFTGDKEIDFTMQQCYLF